MKTDYLPWWWTEKATPEPNEDTKFVVSFWDVGTDASRALPKRMFFSDKKNAEEYTKKLCKGMTTLPICVPCNNKGKLITL